MAWPQVQLSESPKDSFNAILVMLAEKAAKSAQQLGSEWLIRRC